MGVESSFLHSRKPWIPLLVGLLLLAGLGSLVIWQWLVLQRNTQQAHQERFAIAVDEIELGLRERMRAYEMVLRGMSGLLVGSEDVSNEEWQRAAEQLQLQKHYPGIQALGWARYLKSAQVPDFADEIRRSGREDFRIYPQSAQDSHLIVSYIYPLDWRNRRVIGFDMFSEQTRRAAIERARDSGDAVLTGPVVLKQETAKNVQTGVLLYLPVYQEGLPLSSAAERQASLIGVVSGSFRMSDLLLSVLGSNGRRFDIRLTDITDDPLLLASEGAGSAAATPRSASRNLEMYGRVWQLQVNSTARYEASMGTGGLHLSLAAGLLLALLISILVGGFLYLRERSLTLSARQAEDLRESESRFRLVVEASPNAIVLVDSRGRMAMLNQQAEQLFGYRREELLGQPIERLLPEGSRAAHVGMREGFFNNPEHRRMGSNRELFGQRKDGVLIPLEVGLSPIRTSAELLVQAVIIDISERRAAEERFRLVVEASPNAIVLVDGGGRIAMVNRQTELMFGYPREELLGEAVEKLLPESLRGLHVAQREAFLRDPSPRRMGGNRELFGRHREGQLIPLEVGLSPLRSGDDLLVQAVIIDISERRLAEQRLRDHAEQLVLANRYKSEFLANMSHELRTPLNSILILGEQLAQNVAGNLTEKQVRHAEIIHKAGNDLLHLINDVLDLAKIEAGRVQLKLEPVNLQDLLVELDASLRPMAELKGVRLISRVSPGVPRTISGDRGRLQQILRNLLSNALKFTDSGEVELLIGLSDVSLDEERETLEFSVRDTGIGIDPQQHERIFQAFQQIDGSTSRRFGGTGLGLAITRQLVEALDGRISLESAPGKGSRFVVRMPVVALTHADATGSALNAKPLRSGKGPAVLIVEDDANFAGVIAEQAQAHGFASVLCRNGRAALDLLEHEDFAAVILDILLPDLSGWQIYRRLRSLPRCREVPVHIISCVPQPEDWQEDGTRYLVKPVARDDLEQVFADIASPGLAVRNLLLVEDVELEREYYRGHLQQLGFEVTAVGSAAQALQAYAEEPFAVMVIDLNLPDRDGFELLELLQAIRPEHSPQVLINTGMELGHEDLQRLRRYSALAVRKQDGSPGALEAALRGFLAQVAEPLSSKEALSGRRVLLVDDDIRNIYAMSALLDELGLVVITAQNGLEALESFERQPVDLILLDMAMPQMDGYTAAGILKRERGCRVPVIALTAHAMKGDREKCITAGCDDYLAKPVMRSVLIEMLLRWLAEPAEGAPGSAQGDRDGT